MLSNMAALDKYKKTPAASAGVSPSIQSYISINIAQVLP